MSILPLSDPGTAYPLEPNPGELLGSSYAVWLENGTSGLL